MQLENTVLGVDVGASGIKGGLVDISTGRMVTDRLRLDTPKPATPGAVTETFAELIRQFQYQGPIGVGFPAIVRRGVALSAANIDQGWIGTSISEMFSQSCGCPVHVLNDADAAGLATMNFGIGKGEDGTVLMITIGSGLGSALFVEGELVPNTELGHIYLRNQKVVAEQYVSNLVRKSERLSWRQFGKRFTKYLNLVNRIFSPDLVILGGGASKYFHEFEPYLQVGNLVVRPATLTNYAGTIGAAYFAYMREQRAAEALRIEEG